MEQLKICRLPDWGLILIEGQDASAFLQGQLTNSVLGLTITPSGAIAQSNSGVRFTGYCSAKGRLLASGWICLSEHQETSRYAFFVSRDLAEMFAKRLAMFVLRSKVTVSDVSDRWYVYGALESIPNLSPHLPKDAIALTMRHPVSQNHTERIVFASEQDLVIANNQSRSLWDSAEIASAIPRIVHPTQDQFVPQMINLESVGGVDFKKGTFAVISELQKIEKYYGKFENGNYYINFDVLNNGLKKIQKSFNTQKQKLQDIVEKKMNEVIKNPLNGFGFEPTIRNIFAVILANADVYIRLMEDVHKRAFAVGKERKDLIFFLNLKKYYLTKRIR